MARPKRITEDVVEEKAEEIKLNLSEVHQFRRKQGGLSTQLVKTNPAIRLTAKDFPVPVFFQHGKFWYENGEEIKEIPDPIAREAAKLSVDAKHEVGL